MPLFDTEEDKLAYKKEEPIQMALCGEKTKQALSYVTFLGLLPAYTSHKRFKSLMWFLRVEDQQERANEQANSALEFTIDF